MIRLVALLGVLALPTVAAPSQTEEKVNGWIRKSFEAVTIYRGGDTQRAFDVLATMTLEEQEKAIGGIRAQLERIAAGWPPRKEDVVQWTPRLLRALGALQMEAAIALHASDERDDRRAADGHLALAKAVFAIIFVVVKEQEDSAPRWLLVMGLDEMRKGEFSAAFSILGTACEDYPTYAPLLLACGTIYETYSSQPAQALPTRDDVVSQFRMGDVMFRALSPALRGVSRARAVRSRYQSIAGNYFERAFTLDNTSNETLLRLAHLRLREENDGEAVKLLETLLARPSLDARESYLARLFLSRIHERHNRSDEAAAVLKGATTGQTVLIARAHNTLSRGNAAEAAALAQSAATVQNDDYWWGYRFGQYWVPEELLKQLREEARR